MQADTRRVLSALPSSLFGRGGFFMSNSSAEQLQGDSLEASLTVQNLERSAMCYTDVLGFNEDRRYQREGKLMAVSLKAGAVRILLTQDNGFKGLGRTKGVGISLQISSHQSAHAVLVHIM